MFGNLADLIKQAKDIGENLREQQEEMAQHTFDVSVGGGMVTVTANGKSEILSVKIEPQAVDPDDVDMLEDLVLAGVNEALRKAQEMMSDEMSKLTGGMKIPGLF